jgi:hypothetical protein
MSMNELSTFTQKLLGWLAAFALAALLFTGAVVLAQDILDPEDASSEPAQAPDPALVEAVTQITSAGGALTVFETVATCNGAGPVGYGRAGMHAACRLEDPESHFCSLQEIETAWKTNGLNLVLTSQAWIDNAITGSIEPGYTGDFTAVSDWYGGNAVGDYPYNCLAWTNNTNPARGLILNSGSISPATEACDDVHPIACCK